MKIRCFVLNHKYVTSTRWFPFRGVVRYIWCKRCGTHHPLSGLPL